MSRFELNLVYAAITITAIAVLWFLLANFSEQPKPVKTTTIELPLSEQRLAGVPIPRNRPLDYDPEHVAAVLAWRMEFHREIHCQTHIC